MDNPIIFGTVSKFYIDQNGKMGEGYGIYNFPLVELERLRAFCSQHKISIVDMYHYSFGNGAITYLSITLTSMDKAKQALLKLTFQ